MNQLTSPQNVPALPDSWIERIFQRMENFYMGKWIDGFGGIPRERVKHAWAEELVGFTADELKRGLEACKQKTWPPTLPEFMTLCRPAIDPKTEWAEACEQMRIRLKGQGGDSWSRPQVYWAAVSIGQFDLNQNTWEQIRARWEKALSAAKSEPIPEYRAALPQPGQASTSREEASKQLREISEKTGINVNTSDAGSMKWAIRLAEREASGGVLSAIQKSYWREALGVSHETSAKDAMRKFQQDEAA